MKHLRKATALLWLLLAAPAAAAPTVTEFDIPTASALPQDIVLGPDGKLWFTEKDVDKIGRVTPGNPPLIEEFPVPLNFVEPFNITVGPDNKIWFSGKFNGAGGVGWLDPANPAGVQGHGGYGVTGPAGIAAGPDGAIWLGDSLGGQVVRIDPATGNELLVTDIQINAGNFNIRNLAPGPDGNVWVTDFGGQVAKVTPAGVATPYDVPTSAVWDIVTGPDGNLWYTAPAGAATVVGRITAAGTATEFPITAASDPFGITVGPDGALYVAEALGNSIARMTTDGQFTEIPGLTAAARPEYIAAGPANTLWFTEKDGNRIGRITGVVEPPPPPNPTDVTRPNVTRFRITRRVFRAGGLGTVMSWTLSEDARGHDRLRAAREGPLAPFEAEDDVRLHGRLAEAPLQGPFRPQASAEAGPLSHDVHGEGRGRQRLDARPRPLPATAAQAPAALGRRLRLPGVVRRAGRGLLGRARRGDLGRERHRRRRHVRLPPSRVRAPTYPIGAGLQHVYRS